MKRGSIFLVIIPLICGSAALAGGPPLDSPQFNQGSPVAQHDTYHGEGRLGVSLKGITPQLAEYFGLSRPAGALVWRVEEGSPAAKAGMKAGDVIISVGGERVEDPSDATLTIGRKPAGPLEIIVARDKREMTLTAQLERGPDPHFYTFMPLSEQNVFSISPVLPAVKLSPPAFKYKPIIEPLVLVPDQQVIKPKVEPPRVKVKPPRVKKGTVLL